MSMLWRYIISSNRHTFRLGKTGFGLSQSQRVCGSQFSSFQACRSRLLGVQKSWNNLQLVSVTSRDLHVKKGSKNLFSGKHKREKVPPEFSVIYNSSIGPWFVMFRLGMGTIGGILAFFYYSLLPELMSNNFFHSSQGIFLAGVSVLYVSFTSVFSILARQVLTRIYFHPDTGRLIGVQRNLFGRLKQLRYTAEDVEPTVINKEKSTEGWEAVTVCINGQKVYLQSKNFLSPSHYNMHLGAAPDISNLMREPKF